MARDEVEKHNEVLGPVHTRLGPVHPKTRPVDNGLRALVKELRAQVTLAPELRRKRPLR